jgi:hypothetical protein
VRVRKEKASPTVSAFARLNNAVQPQGVALSCNLLTPSALFDRPNHLVKKNYWVGFAHNENALVPTLVQFG